ncbi:hypothetical protein [Longitalea luteola]|uniref:hypothetical protein n=1 Tax=Longitalea luteola TaxID=2812563 RepID=UPI001A96A4EC|nr:hypothetical protein [Longitalea luteola]
MVIIYPCCRFFIVRTCLFVILQVGGTIACAQSLHKPGLHTNAGFLLRDTLPVPSKDTLKKLLPPIAKDSIRQLSKAVINNVGRKEKARITANVKDQIGSFASQWKTPSIDSVKINVNNPFDKRFLTHPAVRVNGGMVCYNFNYRSLIDTPYAEKNILQHNVTGKLNVTVAGIFPLQLNYWMRQSNSDFFKDIYDVQLAFSGSEFHQKIRSDMQGRLLALAPFVADSLLERSYHLKQAQLFNLDKLLTSTFYPQKLIEANEVLKVPKFTWNAAFPDSINLHREDSLKNAAAFFLNRYSATKKEYDQLSKQVDSLKNRYEENLKKVNAYKQMINGNWNDLQTGRQWKNKLQEYGLENTSIPAKYRWLLGVKSFSLGRSPVNYSELTAKNVSVNGINIEYNSWYYFAATAGTVNYRFRDFVMNGVGKKPQFLYLLRAGIGRLEKNYFIVTGFSGQKQLFAANSANNGTIRVSGISAETRWAINRTSYLTAEIGKSNAPDYRNNPPDSSRNKGFLKDKNNRALALHLYTEMPLTRSRVEAFYKNTGANYQSFSSYTTHAAMESWYLKADQHFFNRKLRIAGSLRKNEFSNPFIVQDYKSNTVFKSLTASLRIRKWPAVTVGYQPLSQLTKVDDLVVENRFQTFNATIYHFYTVKELRLATTLMLNKFYNSNSDTGFIYYNATNSYLAQSFFFNSFTANVGASYTSNPNYSLQILEAGIQPNISKFGTVGVGIKINNLNHSFIKAGGYVNANVRIYKQDMLSVSYEHGYLPGNGNRLVRNEMGTVQFIKSFNFR